MYSRSGTVPTEVGNILIPENEDATLSAFPNPSNGSTNISFNLQKPSQAEIQIFNSQGQLIENLGSALYSPGVHSLVWDATQQPNGIYLVVLTMKDKVLKHKIAILK